MFNHNSTGNRARAVDWNNKAFRSGEDLRELNIKSSGLVSQAIKNGHKLKGYFL